MAQPRRNKLPDGATREQCDWLISCFEALPTHIDSATPSEWAERYRYLPQSVTPSSGFFRFDVTPYLREIVDCMGIDSPIRECWVMKGVQIGFTTGVSENVLGYCIAEVKTAPVMWVTADADMAKTRLEVNLIPMLQYSGLDHLIKSGDIHNARKTGRTDKKLEWFGGGCLLPLGAQNPNKFRQQPAQFLLLDEADGWPLTTKNEGDPIKLVLARAKAYEATRKVLGGSTPTLQGQSKIEEQFLKGDQRRYFVCCLSCGEPQTLRWSRINPETGEKTGMVWDMDGDKLVVGSVRYLCQKCAHPHTNDDKTKLLSPEYGAEWRPTAVPVSPDIRSYHLPALLSPPGMQTWEALVQQYLEAFDTQQNRARDLGLFQVFYNEVLGETWEATGSRVRFEQASRHRRDSYRFGQVPNHWARQNCGGPILLLTCAVDVHQDNLAVAVFGWTAGMRAFLIDYWRLEGNAEQLDDPTTWGVLRKIIGERKYTADDGREYWLTMTLVDSGYYTAQVYQFCAQYETAVYPIKGRDAVVKGATMREFSPFVTPHQQTAFAINVDFYKDRWASSLRAAWNTTEVQPEGHFNAPVDCTNEQLKELTRETKREKKDQRTQRRIGWEWHRTAGVRNELWDLMIYNNAALDIVAWDFCRSRLRLEGTHWEMFWNALNPKTN